MVMMMMMRCEAQTYYYIRDISDDSDTVDCITSFPFNTTSSSSILFFVLLWALPDKGDLLID